jgi:type IV pilus assembly protein PilM
LCALLSIDVGKKNIHIVEGSYQKNNIVVERMAKVEVPEGVFQGEMISNPSLLAETITNATQIFAPKEAVVTLNAYGAVIRDIDLPTGKPKEIAGMIKNEMIQTYHIDLDDIIQYKKIDKVTSEDGATLDRYRAAAINLEIVDSYYNTLSETKLKPYAMDININAIDKLFAREIIINDKLSKESGIMLIDFGDTLTTVYIVSKGNPIFFRQLDSGCGEIEKIFSDKSFESEQDIRKMKEDGFNFFGGSEESEKYFNILRPFFYNLTDEIRKVFSFYTSRSNVGNIEQIFLFGGGSNLAGFAEYCENNFGVPTEQVLSISNVKWLYVKCWG